MRFIYLVMALIFPIGFVYSSGHIADKLLPNSAHFPYQSSTDYF